MICNNDKLPEGARESLEEDLVLTAKQLLVDYLLLERARRWPQHKRQKFTGALLSIWGKRASEKNDYPGTFAVLYEPGDYRRAANEQIQAANG